MSRMIPTDYEIQLERVHAEEVTALQAQRDVLLAALEALVERHDALVSSGECGFWDVEAEPVMIQARAAIKGAKL